MDISDNTEISETQVQTPDFLLNFRYLQQGINNEGAGRVRIIGKQ